MRSVGRIWVDVTGISPGSDAAVFSELLCAGFEQAGVDFKLCRRDPGLRVFAWPDVAWCRELPSAAPLQDALSRRQRLVGFIPAPTRRAIVRFVQLQRAVVAAWRGPKTASSLPSLADVAVADTVLPADRDILLMLGMSGDASRFARTGTRLAVLPVDALPAVRADWLDADVRIGFDAWRSGTMPLLSTAMAVGPKCAVALERVGLMEAIQVVGPGAASSDTATPLAPRRFVLAAGSIGVAGATAWLLLAWRRLMETMEAAEVPELVLAGPVGPLADDVLAQLRNSGGLGGKVLLVPFPSADLLSALVRDCLFCIAPDVACGWNRAESESMAIGKACLSASGLEGEENFDPANAAALADRVRAWLAAAPLRVPIPGRGWDEVARDVARAVLA